MTAVLLRAQRHNYVSRVTLAQPHEKGIELILSNGGEPYVGALAGLHDNDSITPSFRDPGIVGYRPGHPRESWIGHPANETLDLAHSSEFRRGVARGVADTAHAARPIRADTATGPGRVPFPLAARGAHTPGVLRVQRSEALRLDVPCRVHIAVVLGAAGCAPPPALVERERALWGAAGAAEPARREPPVHGDESAGVPCRFVLELTAQLAQGCVADRTVALRCSAPPSRLRIRIGGRLTSCPPSR